jgi:hypothetical protein
MRSDFATITWVATAFAGTAVAAGAVLVLSGADEHGTVLALKLTARIAFLLFWPAYVGPGLTRLLSLAPWRHGREFGLAFAAAMLVHAGLIAWLCWIGAAPARGTFLVFGPPLACVYLLALFSVPCLRQALGHPGWRLLRFVGMNAIAAAFARDFLPAPMFDSAAHAAEYAPFAALTLAGFGCQAAALLPPSWQPQRATGWPVRR